MRKIIKRLLILGLLINVGFVKAQDNILVSTKSFENAKVTKVHGYLQSGTIEVIGLDTGDFRIELFARINGTYQQSKIEILEKINENYNVDILILDSIITLKNSKKKANLNWKEQITFHFKIFSPKNISTDLRTPVGNIILNDLVGEQTFNTVAGNIDIDNLNGSISGRTTGGNINLKNCIDQITLNTNGGNISAANCKGRIKLHTGGGFLNLSNLTGDIEATTKAGHVQGEDIFGKLKAVTGAGKVTLKELSSNFEVSTGAGDVSISIKRLLENALFTTGAGNINLSIPTTATATLNFIADKIRCENLKNFAGTKDDKLILGEINGGGASVTGRTMKGMLNLVFYSY